MRFFSQNFSAFSLMGDCTDAAFLVRRGLYEGFGSRICEGRVWQFYYRRRGRLGRPSSSRSTVSPLPLGVGGLKQSAQQRQDWWVYDKYSS
ncbi:hypothetical protein V6N13_096243 [Hibiscus sabdariffa]